MSVHNSHLLDYPIWTALTTTQQALAEGDARAAYHQLGEQVVDGKKALDAVVLDAVGIQEKDRRRPRRLVALAVLLERVGILAWVHARGEKVLVDKARDPLVRPHLGIQPSTAASHRGGVEVQKYWFLLRFCVLQRAIHILPEIDFHGSSRYVPRHYE